MISGKLKTRHIIFFFCILFYVINLLWIIFSGRCVFAETTSVYNCIMLVLDAVFLFIFYAFLKKGALTTRYLNIMFVVLVLIPFLIALASGGVKFQI